MAGITIAAIGVEAMACFQNAGLIPIGTGLQPGVVRAVAQKPF
jgi:hypothetical protein